MNIETVNELIKSLESAGELSIKETKVMALAKAYQQLAAENVALKASIPPLKMINDVTDSWDDVSLAEEVGFNRAISAIMKNIPETPATARILADIKADAITASLDACSDYLETDCVMDRLDISYEEAEKRTSGAIEFHDAMVNFANQLREGADK